MKLFDILHFNISDNGNRIDDRLFYYAAKDCVFSSKIALPIIMFFELYMMISWMLSDSRNPGSSNIGYLIGYVALLLCSAIVLFFILLVERNLKERYRSVIIIQDIYCAFFILWALSFTYIGGIERGNFSIIIYVTVLTIIPVFCFINPFLSVITQGLAAIFVIYVASKCEGHFSSFMINFIVFSIISVVASTSLYFIRRRSYLRQIELEKLAEENQTLAYRDSLTGLKNRRSYMEDIGQITCDSSADGRDNLVLMSADVNGLKKANDTMGHEAGDELLRGAADVIRKTFEVYGDVYRMGGDEFAGILRMSSDDVETVRIALAHNTQEWHGRLVGTLSISTGFAVAANLPDASLKQLETAADEDMYADKKAYYQRTGFERRG